MTEHTREEIKARFADLFTHEERAIVDDLIAKNHFEHVGAAIDIRDQEHEKWLEAYVRMYLPDADPIDSKVEIEMLRLEAMGPEYAVDSPDKDAFWCDRLARERKGETLGDWKEEYDARFVIVKPEAEPEPEPEADIPEDHIVADVADMKPEDVILEADPVSPRDALKALLDEKGIEYRKNAKLATLKKLLENNA
jgi:hypothetical protein